MQYSIMAILLPSQIRNDQNPFTPIRVGDKVPGKLLDGIKSDSRNLISTSDFGQKRLSILVQGTETMLTSFEMPDQILSSSSGTHVCIITNAIIRDLKCILSAGNEISSTEFPTYTDFKWNAFFASSSQPHIILIDPNGKITSVHLSNYISSSNIRMLSFVD